MPTGQCGVKNPEVAHMWKKIAWVSDINADMAVDL